MTLDELKRKVEACREDLKIKSGNVVKFSETGPIGISLIDGIVATLETLEQRIEELERGSRFA